MSRTAAQKRYAEKNKELLRSKDTRKNHHNPVRDAENRNQRNSDLGWRWLGWGARLRQRLTVNYREFSIITKNDLANPQFIFIYKEKKCTELLFSPLPYSSSKPS